MWRRSALILGLAILTCVREASSGDGLHKKTFQEDLSSSSHSEHATPLPRADFEYACTTERHTCSSQPADLAGQMIEDLILSIRRAESDLANPRHYPPHYNPGEEEEFDFIVVGAGSAGSVVANRLTEIEDWRVLLVEAGGDPPKVSEIPSLVGTMLLTDVDWQYKTDPEENNCLGLVNNSCVWSRGKVLGGSSSINYMFYTRGHAKDFDSWAAAGNTGWSYDDVLPYFKKSEDMRDPSVLKTEDAEKYHGTGGYLKVDSWVDFKFNKILDRFLRGMEELGYPFNPDCNGKNLTGCTKLQGTLEDYWRCSTAKAFLSPVKDRRNLKVTKHSLVTKVLVDQETATAYGVELINKEGETIRVRAKKEIILSAGAINSPQLLMLSGIGPRNHLANLSLPVIKDLPVGENLQDHPVMIGLVVTVNYSLPEVPSDHSMFNFLMKKPSRLSSMGSIPYVAFIKTKEEEDYPDLEIIQQHLPKNNPIEAVSVFRAMGVKEEIIDEFIKINENAYSIVLYGTMLQPSSRGRILLQSTDPKTHPKIISGYLSDNGDIQTFQRTYDFISRLVETEPLQSVGAKLHEVRLRNCEKHTFRSREYRECFLRHLVVSLYHYSGSCKMGPAGDPGAVVDPSLRVWGVKGLRVADASIMPTVVRAHTNAAAIMIGEKASDLIKYSYS